MAHVRERRAGLVSMHYGWKIKIKKKTPKPVPLTIAILRTFTVSIEFKSSL